MAQKPKRTGKGEFSSSPKLQSSRPRPDGKPPAAQQLLHLATRGAAPARTNEPPPHFYHAHQHRSDDRLPCFASSGRNGGRGRTQPRNRPRRLGGELWNHAARAREPARADRGPVLRLARVADLRGVELQQRCECDLRARKQRRHQWADALGEHREMTKTAERPTPVPKT